MDTRIGRKVGRRHIALSSTLLAGVILALGSTALADVRDPVPLPRQNPFVTASAVAPQRTEPTGVGKVFGKTLKTSSTSLSQTQHAVLANISSYFNSFRTMQGEFVQVGPRGEQSEGVFVISKPGKIRFHYKPPVRLDIISDGRSVAVQDIRANTQDLYPLRKTPLRYLLADNIDLTSSAIVDEIHQESDLISVVIADKSALVEGKLTLIFDSRSYELRQWVVTDAQGLNTSVAVFNTVTGKKPDPGLFKIYLQQHRRSSDR